ncbi:MAG: hypothetical protein QM682_03515 [Paracoccus sp. (in: a-proteobacteria)]|uniref:hypothetical protein n=1 Tax=Paracoccus sp. TaxID=267 RepID=UPI0039E684B4
MSVVGSLTIVLNIQVHDDGSITYQASPTPSGPLSGAGAVVVTPAAPPASGDAKDADGPIFVSPGDLSALVRRLALGRGALTQHEAERMLLDRLSELRAGPAQDREGSEEP